MASKSVFFNFVYVARKWRQNLVFGGGPRPAGPAAASERVREQPGQAGRHRQAVQGQTEGVVGIDGGGGPGIDVVIVKNIFAKKLIKNMGIFCAKL
jgi:hypothetical protein